MNVDGRSRTYSWSDPIALGEAGSTDFKGAEAEEGRVVFAGEPGEFFAE